MKKQPILITGKDFQRIRQEIKKHQEKKIIFFSDNDELNRKIIEKENIGIMMLNLSKRKDFLKQKNSGLNHILAKIAKKNNISIGINLDEIINSKPKDKAKILGRLMQNIELCKKNKVQMHFVSAEDKGKNKDIYDLKSLGLVLGMPTWMTKSLEFMRLER